MRCLVPLLGLLLAAGSVRAEKVLVNLTHAPVQVQITSVQARGGAVEVAVYPQGVAAFPEPPSQPASRENYTGDQSFCGHGISLPPRGAITLRTCRDGSDPLAVQQVQMTIVPADDPHRDVAAFEGRGLRVDYRAAPGDSGRIVETLDPTFLSRDLAIDLELPDEEDGRLRLVDPEHAICCVIL
jgi:hypothetical protein